MAERDEKGRFLPGVSGNPNGRTEFSLLAIVRRKLKTVEKSKKKETAERIIDNYIDDILKRGDHVAIRDLMDRFDGKAVQKVQIQNEKDAEWLELFKGIQDEARAETEDDTEEVSEG